MAARREKQKAPTLPRPRAGLIEEEEDPPHQLQHRKERETEEDHRPPDLGLD
jgi:hypothetical protein